MTEKKINNTMWICEKYGTSMLESHADDFCARRYAAAHHRDASRIMFSHCLGCIRGAKKFKRAKRTGADVFVLKKSALNRLVYAKSLHRLRKPAFAHHGCEEQ